ncbi:protein PET100 homolog, mitochondrial-like isoform X2 [Dysidea avara]|uniref:protein PET100 homolog, mitochondrial-like isoform X1 n=1 Tax=Dysidea avara TaxID=196820 RepID=UPI00332E8BED
MGNGIELFRMSVYLFFPVGVFYFFNRPSFYDKYVKETREKLKATSTEKMPKTLKEVDELAERVKTKRKQREESV